MPAPRYGLALLLFSLTFFTVTTLGAGWYLATRTDVTSELLPWLIPSTIRQVWTSPALLRLGLQFSVPTLFILFCHEMGHYVVCRRYRLPATLPYFIPAPIALGTFGAFIRIRAPIRSKRELFDVGIGGPIAGFVALLPFLVYGVAQSQPVPIETASPQEAPTYLIVPGHSLLLSMTSTTFHGPLAADSVLDLHPFALAAWVGLLATSLNLLPLGQLDGGHILYAATGRFQRRLALPLVGGLTVIGLAFWKGWLLWAAIALVIGLKHPRVVDEASPLDPARRLLAFVALSLFVLCFMPVPAEIVYTE